VKAYPTKPLLFWRMNLFPECLMFRESLPVIEGGCDVYNRPHARKVLFCKVVVFTYIRDSTLYGSGGAACSHELSPFGPLLL